MFREKTLEGQKLGSFRIFRFCAGEGRTLSTGGYVLDITGKGVQYFTASVASGATKGVSDADEPGTSSLSSSYSVYQGSDAFRDYVVYQPTGGIWVTL